MKKSNDVKITNPENKVLTEKFLNSLVVSGCSNNTIIAYGSDLMQFQKANNFCSLLHNIDFQFNNFIQNYKYNPNRIFSSILSHRSITRKITTIRSFYNYLLTTHQIVEKPNFMTTFKTNRLKRQAPKILSKEEIESLINSCKNNAEKFRGREVFWMLMETLIECLYSSGMRISECLSIVINQIFDNQGKILNELSIIGKGGRTRIIFLNHRAQEAILKFLKKRFDILSVSVESDSFSALRNSKDYLFSLRKSSLSGVMPNFRSAHISRMKVYFTMKKLALMSDINPVKVSPHVFRHSIAVHLLLSKNNDKQNNIALIKSFLGHSSIDTTKVYLGYEDADNLRNILNTSHPLSKIL